MLHRWLALSGYVQGLFVSHTLSPIAAIIFVEEMGIPLVLPGDLAMLLAGVRVSEGRASLWSVLLVEELATIAGAGLLFFASRRLGRPLILRFGRYVGLGPDRVAEAEARIRAHEMRTVVLGRLFPGLRIVTVVAAGVIGVRPAKFFPALALGGFVYLFCYTLLGDLAGPSILNVYNRLAIPAGTLLSMVGLILVVLTVRMLRQSPPASLAMRGTVGALAVASLAAFAGLMTANVLLGLVAVAGQVSARVIDLGLAQSSGELRFLVAWPLFLVIALVIAGLCEALHLRARPLGARLAVTVLVPLAITLLLVEPLGDRATETPLSANLVISVTAAIRWIVFGFILEVLPGVPRRQASAEAAG